MIPVFFQKGGFSLIGIACGVSESIHLSALLSISRFDFFDGSEESADKTIYGREVTRFNAAMFCFFLGSAGGHMFYLRKAGYGALHILLIIISSIIYRFSPFLFWGVTAMHLVWLIVDFVQIVRGKLEPADTVYCDMSGQTIENSAETRSEG